MTVDGQNLAALLHTGYTCGLAPPDTLTGQITCTGNSGGLHLQDPIFRAFCTERTPVQPRILGSFVSCLETDAKDKAIVAATISLAHSLGLKIVAEGVENEAQFSFLQNHECDLIQGYLFSRPLPFADLVKLLQSERQQGAASDGN